MSLKDFHIVFIACSIILTIFFGIWSMNQYIDKALNNQGGQIVYLNTGVFAFLIAIGMIYYMVIFKRKIHNI